MRKPGNQRLGRRLLAADEFAQAAAQRQQWQEGAAAAQQQRQWRGRRLAQDNPFALPEPSPASPPPSPPAELSTRSTSAFAIPLIYENPYLQAAVEAAAEAETEYAEAAYGRGPEPDEADAQSTDPAKVEALEAAEAALLNPLGLEPIWLASARYGTAAMASEIADGDFPQVGWGGWGGLGARFRGAAAYSGVLRAGCRVVWPVDQACTWRLSPKPLLLTHPAAVSCTEPSLVPQDLLDEMLAPLNKTGDGSEDRAPSVAVPGSLDFYLCEWMHLLFEGCIYRGACGA